MLGQGSSSRRALRASCAGVLSAIALAGSAAFEQIAGEELYGGANLLRIRHFDCDALQPRGRRSPLLGRKLGGQNRSDEKAY